MRVFPILELPLLTSPYCSLKTRCCGYTTKQAAAQWADDRLAGFFLAPCLQFCCSQCRSGRRTPVDLGKTQESMVASLKIMIKVYLLQCVRGPKAVGFTMPHRQPVPRMGKKLQEDLLVLTLHGISNYLVKQFVFSCYIHYIQGFL